MNYEKLYKYLKETSIVIKEEYPNLYIVLDNSRLINKRCGNNYISCYELSPNHLYLKVGDCKVSFINKYVAFDCRNVLTNSELEQLSIINNSYKKSKKKETNNVLLRD